MSNEVMSKANEILVQMLEKTIGAVEKGADWLAGEVPEVVQQLLAWHFWQSAILSVIFIIPIIMFLRILPKSHTWKDRYDDYSTGAVLFWFVGGLISLVGTTLSILNMLIALKIIIAPKLYLLEYAASLIK